MPSVEKGGRNRKLKVARCRPPTTKTEKALVAWFNQSRGQNVPIMGPMIQEKANSFVVKVKVDFFFKCTTGWLDHFKKQKCITWLKILGDSVAVTCKMV
ncbi:hypothetical protein PR048_019646 [Dryococelus australis]|uniref:HTH CENPB-type domain-containing protein n=1 Tax=Dryococelus australis TaxID=614101 RepID=A0ABQ9H459_9NEOP|nr:hypothetical protein PR048_019646 [Dryococelus australis]